MITPFIGQKDVQDGPQDGRAETYRAETTHRVGISVNAFYFATDLQPFMSTKDAWANHDLTPFHTALKSVEKSVELVVGAGGPGAENQKKKREEPLPPRARHSLPRGTLARLAMRDLR